MHTRLTTIHRRLFAVVRTIALAIALLATMSAGAQTTLVDTGQPANTAGGHGLFNTNPPLGFNFLACRFTQGSAFTIGSVQAWMVRPSGTIAVKLRANSGSNLPGTELATASFAVSFAGGNAQWTTFGGLSWSQPAGTYWICFEPTFNTTSGSMPGNAPSPLAATAFFTTGNPNYVLNGGADINGRYGLRLYTPAPPAPFNVPAQYATIQAAINAAILPNQEIVVAAGTYNEAINYDGKTINLRSSAGAATTTINATGLNVPAVQIPAGSASGTRLEGFTITGGLAVTGLAQGGGVLVAGSTVNVVACTVIGNDAGIGAGVAVRASANTTFQNCTFSGNDAVSGGGGGAYINAATASFSACDFNTNTANDGGGLNVNTNAQATLTNCTFTDNTASNAAGGAIIIGGTANASFTQCTFEGNTAVQAGGVMVNGTTASFTSCLFDDNTATFAGLTSGGGLQAQGVGTLTLSICSFLSNHAENGAGVQLLSHSGTATVAGCYFEGNIANVFGGGLHCRDSSATMSNTEFYDNEAAFGGGVYVGGISNLGVATSVFCDNLPDGLNGTYTNNGGNFLSCPEPGDTDGNGVVNVGDLLSVINAWGGCPVQPAACPADLDDNGVVSVLDLLMVINNWS